MSTWANTIFYITFLSQIFLISIYFPSKVLARMNSVITSYPPSEYPKLYPKPIEYYTMGQWVYKMINRGIVVLGLLIVVLMATVVDHSTFADDGFISEAWPAAYGMLQYLPFVLLEFSEYGQYKLMREANKATTRKAEFRRRRVSDFVSPMVLGWTVSLFFGCVIFDLYVHDFNFDIGHDTFQRAAIMTLGNLFFFGMGAWHLRGRKLDPHQGLSDRSRLIAANLNSLLFVSMAVSIFMFTAAADDVFELDFLDAILMSVYFQALAVLSVGHMLRSLRLEDIDFDVYRNGPAMT